MTASRRFRVFTSLTTLALALTVAAGLASADRDLAMDRDRADQRAGDFWRGRAGRDDRDQGLRAGRDDRDRGMRAGRDDRDLRMRGGRDRDERADARPGRPPRLGKHHGRAQGRRAPGRGR